MAFAWVTAGFAIAEYKGVIPKDLSNELDDWKPSELPPVPEQQKQIKRGEVIAGIVFTVIALGFVSISSHLIGIPIVLNNEFVTIIPIFNREAFVSILPLIYLFFGIGLLKECLKLISGQWTNKLAFSTLILNAITIGLVFIVFKNDAIWNPNFMAEMSRLTGVQGEAYLTIDQIWQRTTLSIYILFTIILIADTITAFYKSYKR
ncbi:hypothetical protein H1D32_02555 [Anaerobacillus sp. CMMVII]|nr:hypothetical protein [Anaerobacillus sp. CMMVII]MCT8136729.1 hypothetical protein [Anaerobacillus sp. CMMVII]